MSDTHVDSSRTRLGRAEFEIDPAKLAWRVLLFCVVCEVLFVIFDYHIHFAKRSTRVASAAFSTLRAKARSPLGSRPPRRF